MAGISSMAASENRDTPLERYMTTLELLAPHADGLTQSELERALDLPKASVNRMVHVLLDSGLIAPSPGRARAFQLGPRILHLLHGANDTSWLERISARPLQQLAAATEQSAFLARLYETEIRSVNCVAPDTTVRLHIVPGTVMPPHASASAKAILSYLPPDLRDRILDAHEPEAFTSRTLTDRAELVEDIARVPERGYSIECGEHVYGLASVARPIFGPSGEVRYVVGLTGPENSILGSNKEHNLAALAEASEKLSRMLTLPMT